MSTGIPFPGELCNETFFADPHIDHGSVPWIRGRPDKWSSLAKTNAEQLFEFLHLVFHRCVHKILLPFLLPVSPSFASCFLPFSVFSLSDIILELLPFSKGGETDTEV